MSRAAFADPPVPSLIASVADLGVIRGDGADDHVAQLEHLEIGEDLRVLGGRAVPGPRGHGLAFDRDELRAGRQSIEHGTIRGQSIEHGTIRGQSIEHGTIRANAGSHWQRQRANGAPCLASHVLREGLASATCKGEGSVFGGAVVPVALDGELLQRGRVRREIRGRQPTTAATAAATATARRCAPPPLPTACP
jgi:hypothetical protein